MIPTERQKNEVRKLLKKWQPKLYLHQWNFNLVWSEDGGVQAARVDMQPEYKFCALTVFSGFWEHPKETREEMLIHELCHCLVQPLVELAVRSANGIALTQQDIDYHKEAVVQHITVAIKY